MQKSAYANRGFSLVELMVAMTVGLLLLAGVYTVQTSGHRTFVVSESQSRMLDDARFAMELLARDIRLAGSWGDGGDPNATIGRAGQADSLDPISGDCEANWYNNIEWRFNASENSNPYGAGCIDTGYVTDTDVLVMRYAQPDRIANNALVDNLLYIQVGRMENLDGTRNESGSGIRSQLFVGNVDATPSITANNNYVVQSVAYYVSNFTDSAGDGYPSLHRISLTAGTLDGQGPVLADEVIAPGVMNFQVQYGLDIDDDGSINHYVDADDIAWDDVAAVEQIAALRVWLLLRSELPDVNTDAETYTMGSGSYTPNNNFRHNLVSAVFKLRNKVQGS